MPSGILLGQFKVYERSRAVPSGSCDLHTRLILANGIAGPIASLANAVSGPCEIKVDETERTFNLQEVAGSCGTRRYLGTDIEVIDNRARYCEDVIGADVVVNEVTTSVEERLVTTTFYSFDPLFN